MSFEEEIKRRLIEKWESAIEAAEFYGKGKEDRLIEYMLDFVDDLNQLDEPEVLSQELPAIPQFVADWIEEMKLDNSLRVAFEYIAQRKWDNRDDELASWVEEGNSETFARAWLDGFTVEVEQKYYVLNNEGETMIRKDDSGVGTSSGFKIDNWLTNEGYKLTEQEIKDYDPRYWAFRKPVEDLEQ